jgi:hypothetical protein
VTRWPNDQKTGAERGSDQMTEEGEALGVEALGVRVFTRDQ